MNPTQAALVIGVSERTLSKWRTNRRYGKYGKQWGPLFTMNGNFGRVDYSFSDIQGWADARGINLEYIPTKDMKYFVENKQIRTWF